jgi:hypothetical protein
MLPHIFYRYIQRESITFTPKRVVSLTLSDMEVPDRLESYCVRKRKGLFYKIKAIMRKVKFLDLNCFT